MSDNITFDIQTEIIKRVPDVKSLLRFRAVSKSWKSLIDSSEFITGYGTRETQPRRLLLRYKKAGDPREVKYVSFVDDENDILTQQDFAPLLMKQFNFEFVIGGSCGLWCLHGYKNWPTHMIVIWNPSIRKSVGSVVPRVLTCSSNIMTRFGFGVCPSTYDPTIVRMSYQQKDTHNTWQVGIFTLSSKTWKMIPSSNLPRESIRLESPIQAAIDRFIYWISHDRDVAIGDFFQYKHLILSFDLITHKFKEINLPDRIGNQFARYCSIHNLRESLAVSAYTKEVNGRVYGIWMMREEGGVMTSFTKLFTINTPDSAIRRLLGFRKSGEPIMETLKKTFDALEVFEPCSEHFNNLGIYGENGSFFIRPYTETLLLIDHSDGCIISNDY